MENNNDFEIIENGTITDVPRFYAQAVHSGVRRSRKDDLCILYTPNDTVASAVFTTNKFCAAPVVISKEQVSKSRNIKAIVINTGIANACTGEIGLENSKETVKTAAKYLKIDPSNVAVASTGLIGKQLPMEKIVQGIKEISKDLDENGGHRAARSILTIDKNSKEIAIKIRNETGGKDIYIGAIGKGSIMIAPNMATTLCFIASNVKISYALSDKFLREAVEHSFNAISVDGCQSTNDMIFLLNNGESGLEINNHSDKYYSQFKEGLYYVLEEMAKKVILDGEGASKFVEIEVCKSRSKAEAQTVGMKIANSILFKAAVFGETVNWGRIASAIGSLDIEFIPEKVDIYMNGYIIFHEGMEVTENMESALSLMHGKEISVRVDLNTGSAKSNIWTTDLTHDFVKASSHYRS